LLKINQKNEIEQIKEIIEEKSKERGRKLRQFFFQLYELNNKLGNIDLK
jgi:hypothetical protein